MLDPVADKQGSIEKRSSSLLSVIVPIYNEAECLDGLLKELIPYCQARAWQLILVNDGSTDGTSAILQEVSGQHGVRVVHHKVNRGYGGALKTGLSEASTPYCVTIDADGQHSLVDVDTLLAFAVEKDADLVVGQRSRETRPDLYRRTGKWLIRKFAGLLMPVHISDLNSGFKLYRTDLVQRYLSVCPDSMAFSDVITLVFIKKHHLVLEHPIAVRRRASGKSTINTFTAFQTIFEIVNITMLFNPQRIFLPLAAFCVTFGFVWGIPIMLRGRGVSVGAMLAIVTGLLCLFFGLIAQQLSSLQMSLLDQDKGRKKE